MNIVILDRDGVINHDASDYIKSALEWQAIPGSIEAIAALTQAGFRLFVATNQSGLARGLFDASDLAAMHEKMTGLVEAAGGHIERIFFCPHHPKDACNCRKPLTGMLDQLEGYLGFSIAGSFLVGDSRKDLELALAKRCQPLLVLTGNGNATAKQLPHSDIPVFANLAKASEYIIQSRVSS